jgi:hypothetical protein
MRFSIYAAGAALLFAGAAQAVTTTSFAGEPDPGFGTETLVASFSAAPAAGYSLSGDFGYADTTTGTAAEPAGDTSRYAYVSGALGSGIGTLSTPDLRAISFYWGSIDAFNSVDVLGAGGVTLKTVNGADISAANGNQTLPETNRRVVFTADPGEVITGLRFKSTGVAFEFDSIAAAAVPEPASWAMMVAGFGLVGAASRKRRRNVVAA